MNKTHKYKINLFKSQHNFSRNSKLKNKLTKYNRYKNKINNNNNKNRI